ncbi:MAG: tripartite tricarboxylate transporter substrate binding protein [Alphaproteobacteria bacterium]|nr:tripartite tricarboxylate transporter substrate binding protein [Alphaproteobacteria bacterium]MCW5738653.1 tripartite tricarboxylate transporter substrate binding protein [Alphaproteobacteria bacterium]
MRSVPSSPFLTRRRALMAGTASLLAAPALAQGTYPSKQIRIIVAFAPGGATDILGRIVADHLSKAWNTQVIVDNKTGAGGNLGSDLVAKAAPDGYTLLLGTVGSAVTNQFLYKNMPFDTATAFTNIALVGEVANVLVVHPDVPARTVQEYIAMVKAKPGQMNYGSPAIGGTGHLAMEYLQALTGMKLEHIVYRGSSLVLQDLLAGNIPATMDNLPAYIPHTRTGKLRALGVSTAKRWFALPDVPTIAEQGVPGYDAAPWWYVSGPAGMPAEIVKKLSDEIVKAVGSPEVEKRIKDAGCAPIIGDSAALTRHIASETVKWKKVADAAGLKPQ